ncbi:S8 family serine peptidase [Skermanella sp. TT6]|uniref:S8 family serine peptidase n=1 Tax=Skermanella cutis TaxID=2775420 RepID=A0ABX7B5C2_9PROT|nr:S8 family peptidase [Skermanella sp. TT6]QQP89000.1 S8 family serine peptidase [Skermanella sp. TT6]
MSEAISDYDPQSGDGCELIITLNQEPPETPWSQHMPADALMSGLTHQDIAAKFGIRFRRLFGRADGSRGDAPADRWFDAERSAVSRLEAFFAAEPLGGRMGRRQLEEIAERLAACPEIAAAYVKPPAAPATLLGTPDIGRVDPGLKGKVPSGPMPSGVSDFRRLQSYLEPAPGGVDAFHAWSLPGGRGEKVRIIDVEGGWQFTHEALRAGSVGLQRGSLTDPSWRNHGTAVLALLGGSHGVMGVAPGCQFGGVSIFRENGGVGSAEAIYGAAAKLEPGDIILIEIHRPGPGQQFSVMSNQSGYIATEWWDDDFTAIRKVVDDGIIVVAVAGNGGENLDDPLYDSAMPGFPHQWRNPFRRGARDSGAILVGAGAPPCGSHGPNCSRLGFSNYGSAVDAQGWGREVVTAGYGDLQGGADEDRWYTGRFSGTSSAAAMVAGVLACIQGIRRAAGLTPLNPGQARDLLRASGTPQAGAPGKPAAERIGSRPDLKALTALALSFA